MNSQIKHLVSAVQLACCAAVLLAGYTPSFAQGKSSPVFIVRSYETELFDKVEALGTLLANESVTVSAQVTEIITAINFVDGQRVKKDHILAEMTSAEENAQLKEAEATVREAKENLDRAVKLDKQLVTTKSALSERRRNYETAVARLEAVKSRIGDRSITAPFAGVVGLRRISVGALVQPGTAITTLDDDSVMKLDFTIPATFLSTTKEDLPIIAKAEAFGDREFRGKVTGIDSRIEPATRSITVRAILPNPDGILKAGALMTVEVLKNKRQAIVVPEHSIIVRGTKAFVYVVNKDAKQPKVEQRTIKTGSRQSGLVEVLTGLKSGEYVVTDGKSRVRPGGAVRIMAVDKNNKSLDELLKQSTKSR